MLPAASLVIGLLAATSVPHAAAHLSVLVRVDVDRTVRDVDMKAVVSEIRRVWQRYLDLEFVDAADIVESVYDDEIKLFVTSRARTANAANPFALGWITFPEPGRPSNLVTVSVGAVRSLMARGQWRGWRISDAPTAMQRRFLNRAIGRSAAHEIGHYLLRSASHQDAGLMRAQLSASDIMEESLELTHLSPGDVAALDARATAGLLARTQGHAEKGKG